MSSCLPPRGKRWVGAPHRSWHTQRVGVQVVALLIGLLESNASANGRPCIDGRIGHYSAIPLDPTAAAGGLGSGSAVDGQGDLIAYGGTTVDDLLFLDRQSGARSMARIFLAFGVSQQLSATGTFFFFVGWHPGSGIRITRLNVSAASEDLGPASAPHLFRADRSGDRLAFMQRPQGPGTPPQYFLYDFASGQSRQLTDAPDAIDINPEVPRCVQTLGATPVITADGSEVVVITPSTLGLADQPWVEGACNVMAYSAEQQLWRRVTTLSPTFVVDFPTIDDTGRLLSFVATEPFGEGGRRTTPQLLSVETGELVELPASLYAEAGFDSVITRDGRTLIVSSRADLDPLGGNADRNMEIFRLDLSTMTFEQVTFSTGGIGHLPGGCPGFDPSRSDDGSVLVFATPILSISPCQLDGPTRDECTGMVLGRVRTVPRRPGNQPPVLTWSGATTVAVEGDLRLTLRGSDPDGDPLTFWAQPVRDATFLPEGSDLRQDASDRATLHWQPSASQRGPLDLRLALFDEGGAAVTTDVRVMVCGAVFDDSCRSAAVAAIFGFPTGACADANRDGTSSAADLISVGQHAHTCVPDVPDS